MQLISCRIQTRDLFQTIKSNLALLIPTTSERGIAKIAQILLPLFGYNPNLQFFANLAQINFHRIGALIFQTRVIRGTRFCAFLNHCSNVGRPAFIKQYLII